MVRGDNIQMYCSYACTHYLRSSQNVQFQDQPPFRHHGQIPKSTEAMTGFSRNSFLGFGTNDVGSVPFLDTRLPHSNPCSVGPKGRIWLAMLCHSRLTLQIPNNVITDLLGFTQPKHGSEEHLRRSVPCLIAVLSTPR